MEPDWRDRPSVIEPLESVLHEVKITINYEIKTMARHEQSWLIALLFIITKRGLAPWAAEPGGCTGSGGTA